MNFRSPFIVLVLGLPFLLSLGCAQKKPQDFQSDQALYDHGMSLYKDGDFSDAIPFFESLRNRFPRSPLAPDAELKIADSHFEQEEFLESEIAYQSFRTLYPTHPMIPHVVFRIGMSHFEQVPGGPDRDQTHTTQALEYFKEVKTRWPDREEAKEAIARIEKCERLLAERELYVANFYLKQNNFKASLNRLEDLRRTTSFADLRTEATYKLAHALHKTNQNDRAKKLLTELTSSQDSSEYQKKAQELLKKIQ